MGKDISIGLIGDFNPTVTAHQAIPVALKRAGDTLQTELRFSWIPTERITSVSAISSFSGLWCVPASPYRNMDGALLAIRYARENHVPFLGTCGGFQHAIIEFARNVLGWPDADHAETAPNSTRPVISPLECSLVEATRSIRLIQGTRIAAAYGTVEAAEQYRCRFGLNPEFKTALLAGPLQASAFDETGEVRAIELNGHPFFVATLFQPERAALNGHAVPLVNALACACLSLGTTTE